MLQIRLEAEPNSVPTVRVIRLYKDVSSQRGFGQ
jgi:hypothetical protein